MIQMLHFSDRIFKAAIIVSFMSYKNKMKQNMLLLNKIIENLNQETESIKITNENCEMEKYNISYKNIPW